MSQDAGLNMMDTQHLTLTGATAMDQITEFKDKSAYETEINRAWRRSEPECVKTLFATTDLDPELSDRIYALAFDLAHSLRERKDATGKAGIVQGLLQEFSLSSQEGIALMCLAEALLRIPDKATRDLLIKDKINQGELERPSGTEQSGICKCCGLGTDADRETHGNAEIPEPVQPVNRLTGPCRKRHHP